MTINVLANDTINKQFESDAWFLDPLEDDETDESIHSIGLRAIVRIALVASEAGARFQREGLSQDPMAWMVSPLDMFAGLPPIEACMTLNGCARAILVHGLCLDLDAPTEAIDALMSSGNKLPASVIANCASPMDFSSKIKRQQASVKLI